MATNNVISSTQFNYGADDLPITSKYLAPKIFQICQKLAPKKVLEMGCGNGAISTALARLGAHVVACDPSEDGVEAARKRLPAVKFHVLGVYDDPTMLVDQPFDVVVSTEVIEHLFLPRALPRFAKAVLTPGGHLVVSTVYHGYLKNLLLALLNKWDTHWTPFWDGGHIKLWSRRTLSKLLREEGFEVIGFVGADRIPYLWRSMVLIAKRR